MGSDVPARPVAESKWLDPTGQLPLVAADDLNPRAPEFDIRPASDGGCDSPAHFEGCHVYYIKVQPVTQLENTPFQVEEHPRTTHL